MPRAAATKKTDVSSSSSRGKASTKFSIPKAVQQYAVDENHRRLISDDRKSELRRFVEITNLQYQELVTNAFTRRIFAGARAFTEITAAPVSPGLAADRMFLASLKAKDRDAMVKNDTDGWATRTATSLAIRPPQLRVATDAVEYCRKFIEHTEHGIFSRAQRDGSIDTAALYSEAMNHTAVTPSYILAKLVHFHKTSREKLNVLIRTLNSEEPPTAKEKKKLNAKCAKIERAVMGLRLADVLGAKGFREETKAHNRLRLAATRMNSCVTQMNLCAQFAYDSDEEREFDAALGEAKTIQSAPRDTDWLEKAAGWCDKADALCYDGDEPVSKPKKKKQKVKA